MQEYFVTEPGASPHGPYAEAMVKRAFEHGMYPHGTKVWWEGAENWTPIEFVFGNRAKDAAPPPHVGFTNTPHGDSSAMLSVGWNIINAFTSNMIRYAHFEGRSCKSEYWYFILAQIIIALLSICFGEKGFIIAAILMTLAFFVPNMAICFRRLQDAGYNGTAGAVISGILDWVCLYTLLVEELLVWDLLILVFCIVLGCMSTKNANNPYGRAPLPPV